MTCINRRALLRWLPTVLLMGLIFCFSAQPADASSQTSQGVMEILGRLLLPNFEQLDASQLELFHHLVRKLAHFSIYTLLGAALALAQAPARPALRRWLLALALAALYAVSDELHQLFVAGRGCQFTDMLIDSGGAAVGSAVAVWLRWAWGRRIGKRE